MEIVYDFNIRRILNIATYINNKKQKKKKQKKNNIKYINIKKLQTHKPLIKYNTF